MDQVGIGVEQNNHHSSDPTMCNVDANGVLVACQCQSTSLVVAIIFKSQQSASIGFTPKMPAGRKSAGGRKPRQRQRRVDQKPKAGAYLKCVSSAQSSHNETRRPIAAGVYQRPKAVGGIVGDAVKLDYMDSLAILKFEDENDPNIVDVSDIGAIAKFIADNRKMSSDDDIASETSQNVFGPMPNENATDDDWSKQLSHNMAKFLRHTAYHEDLLGDDGWVRLCDALPRLEFHHGPPTAAQVAKAVRLSDRYDDEHDVLCYREGTMCCARFEMYISGSCTWIRATDGAYYRQRSQR